MFRKMSFVLLFFSFFLPRGYTSTPEVEENHELIEYAVTHLSQKGTLEQTELEIFRQSEGLSPKVNGHDFHITIAIEYANCILSIHNRDD